MDDFAALQKDISSALVATTRSAGALASEDLTFHRSLSPAVGTQLDRQNARLLGLAERLIGSATAHTETVVRRPAPTSLREIEDIEANWGAVVDVVDSLLERADTALDEFTGAVRRLSPREQTPTKQQKPSRIAAALKSQDVAKPQLLFEHVPKNAEKTPFKPLLLAKPHASIPLELEPKAAGETGLLHHAHPYQREIEEYSYPSTVYTHAEPIPYHPFETTKATFVDTEEALDEMLQELKKAKEIAVDLEHHDQRSYIGIVSLMQISTRDRDWIVDTLRPWRRKLHILNEVFADPSILKVLHGAYMDIIWLQRDLGLYIVGLFDTHYAARALGYAGGSYAFLLKKFTGVDAQKQYQMADWRVRPLPQELIDYARSDTHYLLYVYDNMRNEMIERSDFSVPDHEKDKVHSVLERSRETALQRYEHPIYDYELGQGPSGWHKILSRTPAVFSREEFAVFRAVHQWRDQVAREQDDSVHYVLPNHAIFTLARTMPASKAELLNAVQPATQTLRLRADELVAVIRSAKKEGAESGPEMMDVMKKVEPRDPTRKAFERAAQHYAATFEGVAKFLPQNQSQRVDGGAQKSTSSPTMPIRTLSSMFWGHVTESSKITPTSNRAQRRSLSTVPDIQLTIPLPALTAEVFADPSTVSTPGQQQQPAPPSPQLPEPQLATEDDDVFVLKEMGRKRKRAAAETAPLPADADAMATQNDEVAILDEQADAESIREKDERKRLKEAKRAAKRAAKEAAEAKAGAEAEEEAFDYNAAPSVLNPERPRMSREERKKASKKEFDPYKKAMDAPKGLPRAQRERAGKSMTFKK